MSQCYEVNWISNNLIISCTPFHIFTSQVMIPLSSIPTYSASMDSSSFLKTSFNKFPYPTKAELCYLTVVTKFPEEQIKIWFTAQRLKQGISWSPEEIEEARRKMFNTIIQTAPSSSQNQSQRNSAPQTITVLPASLGATGIPHILQGSLVSQGGVIVTQPVVANGIQVSSAPVALAVTPKPQPAAHPMMQARPAAALVADKGVSMVVGTVGSSSTGSNIISNKSSQTGGGNTSSQSSVINLSLGSSNQSSAKMSGINGKHNSTSTDCSDKSNSSHAKNTDISKTNNTSIVQSYTKVVTESKTTTDSKSNNSNSKSISSGQKSKDSESSSNDNTTITSIDNIDRSTSDSPNITTEEASSPASKSSSPSSAATSSITSGSQTPVNTFLDPIFYKGKKSQEQLGALKDSFQVSQFPDQEEVERLVTLTGLTVREVRKWFSDRRYHFRNLKGSRSGTGVQPKSGTAAGTPGSGSGSCGSANPLDLSEISNSSGAKTPVHSTAPVSPTPAQTPTSPTTPSRRLPRPPSPDFTAIRYKEREPHQVSLCLYVYHSNLQINSGVGIYDKLCLFILHLVTVKSNC